MPNRTLPEFLKDDLELNQLPMRAVVTFYRIHHVMDDSHRFKIGPSPQTPTLLRAAIYALCPKISDADVAVDLQRLVDARAILLRDSERGWYGEIAEHLRYRKEDFEPGAPRYGPRRPTKPVAIEQQLPLGPMGAVPPAPMKPQKFKSSDYDSVHDLDHDSKRVPSIVPKLEKGESMNRALSSGKDPERFARDPEDITKFPIGMRLCRFLGMAQFMEECRYNGARWVQLVTEQGADLDELLGRGERIASTELPNGKAKARWLTVRINEQAA